MNLNRADRSGNPGSTEPPPRPARHVLRLFLRATGYSGICLPPFGIFILGERLHDPALLRHEQCHWRQAERMGAARWPDRGWPRERCLAPSPPPGPGMLWTASN